MVFNKVSASVDAGTATFAFKSPVMTTVLTIGNMGPRTWENSNGAAALGLLYTTATGIRIDAWDNSHIRYSGLFSNLPGISGDL